MCTASSDMGKGYDMGKMAKETIGDLKCTIAALQFENDKLKKQMEDKSYVISMLRDQFSELQEKYVESRTVNISNSTVTIGK
jgi:predicted RNase H-like nuclease (RuvC/YqgF family)